MRKKYVFRFGMGLILMQPLGCMFFAQNIYVSPKLLQFPNQGIGTTSLSFPVTLNNDQTGTLNIQSILVSAPFSQTNNCGASLTAGQTCTVNITFSPTAVKYYSSSLTISDSASNSPQIVALTGSGVVPATFSPKQISFPSQVIGTTSAPAVVTLTNNQSAAMSISGVQVQEPFMQTNNCGASLAAGKSCSLNITFGPTAVKYYSSSLTITDNSSNSPQTIALAGSGVDAVSYTPKVIAFPSTKTGTSSSPSIVTLTNNQSVVLSISGIQTSLPFAQTNNCGSSVAAGQSCTLNITFSPTAVKYYSSSLTITDNSTNSPQTIALSGSGVALGGSGVTYTPKSGGLYFNNQIVSTPSTPQPVTITNGQSVELTFNSITSSADYPFTTNCGNGTGGGSLAAGATCTIQVSFDPTAIGKRAANLTIAESAGGSPIVLTLQGSGIAGTPGSGVNVTPPAPCVLPSGTEQFSASVTGESNTAVSWYVDDKLNGNATVGTISATGLYAAPNATGSHFIKAVSQASTTVYGDAKLTVTQTPVFEIYPFVASIPVGGQQTFQAQMCLVPESAGVSYTVDNIAGGNATVGTISNDGVYTAPPVAGKHTIRVADSAANESSGAVVTVFSGVTADFGSRTDTAYPIPAEMFGTGRGESIPTIAARALLTQAGLTETRLSAVITSVYATQTPNWSKIDPLISAIQAAGQHAILQLNESPAWLQPTSGTCAGSAFAAPTDDTEWTQIAVSYVAHLDSTFPGVVQDYEIWNEPNATGMCTTADHLNTYVALYAAAVPAMKAQAAQDGQTIRIGGPAISGYSELWLSTLLTNSSTAPYVDFVSYHEYLFGLAQLQAKWDSYTGNISLYEETQDPSNGAFINYSKVLAQVAAGKQPGGAKTPIYVTEYNTNWAFFQDCCRNSPTYAPLWNALYVTDLLDSVYNGTSKVPDKLIYFAGSAYPWFCMIGVKDSNMDCLYSVGATPVPYPQYFTYQLLASSDYLGLSAGGYMAKSLTPPTGGGGLATTAFYTPTQDGIIITNPTSTAYSQISVTFANPGFSSNQGTLYSIANGAQIKSTAISFATQGTSLSTTIDVPPYSVQAISLK